MSHRTAFNVVTVSLASFLQIVNQFLFFRVNSIRYGADENTDQVFFALSLSTVVSAVITGSISYVLVPELVAKFEGKEKEADEPQSSASPPTKAMDGVKDSAGVREGWQLASFIGLLTLCVCSAIGGVIFVASDFLCSSLTWEAKDPQELAVQISARASYLRIFALNILFMGLISWAQAVLHSRHQFFVAALGGVLGTGVQLLFLIVVPAKIEMIAYAIVLGSAISFLVHSVPLVRRLRFPKADLASLSRLLVAFWPLLLGAAFLRLDPMFNAVWADELDSGILSRFHYAFRIMMALLTIGTSSLALVAFPQLAERFATEGMKGFTEHFALCLRRITLIIQPVVIGVSCFAVWIVADLLESPGGKFGPDDSWMVGWLVVTLMGMFIGASMAELLSRGYYVLGDTRTPTLIGVLCLAVGLGVKFSLFKSFGIWGIAGGISIYYLATSVVLAIGLWRKTDTTVFAGSLRYTVEATAAALFACGCCYLIYGGKFGGTLVAAPVGVVAYGGALLILRNEEAWSFAVAIRQRLRR